MKRTKWGGFCWLLCLQYFAAEAIAVAGWRGGYSFHDNYISDLGALACVGSGCSPLHPLMNASFLLQGVLISAGAVLVWPAFPRGWLRALALGLIAASGLGVFVVGLAPEDFAPGWHYLGAGEHFLFCNAGAAQLGLTLLQHGRATRRIALFSLAVGLLGLVALTCLATHAYFGLGVGGMERVSDYPASLWVLMIGIIAVLSAGTRAGHHAATRSR